MTAVRMARRVQGNYCQPGLLGSCGDHTLSVVGSSESSGMLELSRMGRASGLGKS